MVRSTGWCVQIFGTAGLILFFSDPFLVHNRGMSSGGVFYREIFIICCFVLRQNDTKFSLQRVRFGLFSNAI